MYISMNWIKDFVDLEGLDIQNVISRFGLSTAEVEGVERHGFDTSGVVVGEVLNVLPHEKSEKLKVLTVTDGKREYNVVCGAPNVTCGMKVPFAKVGSKVKGTTVKEVELVGVKSEGVCLSEKELGISDDHSGLMDLSEYEAGQDIKNIMDIEDIVFEVDNKSLTNRPDLWGHYGIAREIAAIMGRELKPLNLQDTTIYSNLPKININIESPDKCYRYTSIAVDNVTRKQSPLNMRIRLYYAGTRAINLLADLTNYLMIELGQPMHAFDRRLVDNLYVKTFDEQISFKTLDNETRKVDAGTLMICDSNEPVAIAGIMGGEKTEITDETTSLLLESANFDPTSIRKSAIKLGLRTEASARYEKTLDPEMTLLAIERYIALLKEIDPGCEIVSSVSDVYPKKYEEITIDIDKEYITKRIGIDIELDIMVKILTALKFEVEVDGQLMHVKVPSYRATKDVSIKADIVEEIARIYGYDNIPAATTKMDVGIVSREDSKKNDYIIKDVLANKYDLSEVHSYIWYNSKLNKELGIKTPDNIKIINSLTAEDSTLRECFGPTILNMISQNVKYYDDVNIFEVGKVFSLPEKDKACVETKTLAIGLSSKTASELQLLSKATNIINSILKQTKNKQASFTEMSDPIYNWISPVNGAYVICDEESIGYVGVLDLRVKNRLDKKLNVVLVEINLDKLNALEKSETTYSEVTKYQTVSFDLSVLLGLNDKYAMIEDAIKQANLEYLMNYSVIDMFEDKEKLQDKKSITIRFVIGAMDHTLTSEEIQSSREKLLQAFEKSNITMR